MSRIKNVFAAGMAALVIGVAPNVLSEGSGSVSAQGQNYASDSRSRPEVVALGKEVRKRLVRLPYYGVFDNLAYSIDGSRVTLHGQVVRPSTRSDAERSVSRIAGVTQVVNQIQVLPLSGFDDQLRVSTYRAIQRTGGLYRYFMGGHPSLHIIVDRGHVTLTGMVGSKMDAQLAYMAARGVSGAFSVTNELRVEGQEAN